MIDSQKQRIAIVVICSAIVLLALYVRTLWVDLDRLSTETTALQSQIATLRSLVQTAPTPAPAAIPSGPKNDEIMKRVNEFGTRVRELQKIVVDGQKAQQQFQERVAQILKRMAERLAQGGAAAAVEIGPIESLGAEPRARARALAAEQVEYEDPDVPLIVDPHEEMEAEVARWPHLAVPIAKFDPVVLSFPVDIKQVDREGGSVMQVQVFAKDAVILAGDRTNDERDRLIVRMVDGKSIVVVPRVDETSRPSTIAGKVGAIENRVFFRETGQTVGVRLETGRKTVLSFPVEVVGGFRRSRSNLTLSRRGKDVELAPLDGLTVDGEAVLIKLKDGRWYSVRARRADAQHPADISLNAALIASPAPGSAGER